MTGNGASCSFQAARRVILGCSRSQACAVAVPYKRVWVLVRIWGTPQVAGSAKTNSPPCLGGRPVVWGIRGGVGRHKTRSERIRPRICTGRSPSR